MRNIDAIDKIQKDGTETEKVSNSTYLGRAKARENRTRLDLLMRIKAGWSVMGKCIYIFLYRHFPMRLKRKIFNQCVLPAIAYDCQT